MGATESASQSPPSPPPKPSPSSSHATDKSDPNCVEPACQSKMAIFKDFMKEKSKENTRARKAKEEPKHFLGPIPDDCPLDREQLGHSTWELLHSIGIYYPENPNKEYQEKIRVFIETLGLMYPCDTCAKSFAAEIAKSPPRVESRTSLSLWLCEQHNIVSKRIHKPLFECTMEKLDERWRKGRDECWGDLAEEAHEPSPSQ